MYIWSVVRDDVRCWIRGCVREKDRVLRLRYCCCLLRLGVIPGRLRSRRQELRSGFPDDASVLLPDAGRLADAPHNKDRVLCTSGRSFGTTSVAGFGDAFGRRIGCCGWVSYPDGYVHAGRSCGAAFPMMRPCCSLTQGGSQTHHIIRIECCVHLVGRSGRRPLLDSGMRSGEGSSAAVALLLLSAAVGCHTRTATFTQAGVCGAAFPMMRPCCFPTQGESQTHHMMRMSFASMRLLVVLSLPLLPFLLQTEAYHVHVPLDNPRKPCGC